MKPFCFLFFAFCFSAVAQLGSPHDLTWWRPSGRGVTTNAALTYFGVTLTNDTGARSTYFCPNETTVFSNVVYLIGVATGHGGGGAVTNCTSVFNGDCVATLVGAFTNFNTLASVKTEQLSVWRFATNAEVVASKWTATMAGPAGGANIVVVGITNIESGPVTDGGAMAIRQQNNWAADAGTTSTNIFADSLHPSGTSLVVFFAGNAATGGAGSSNANSQLVEIYDTGYASPSMGAWVGIATNLPVAKTNYAVTMNGLWANKIIEIQKTWQ